MDLEKPSPWEKLETDIQIAVIYLRQKRFYRATEQFRQCVLQSQQAMQLEKNPDVREKARELEKQCYSISETLEAEGDDIELEKLLQEIDDQLDVTSPDWYRDHSAILDEQRNEAVLRDRIEFLETELRQSEQTVKKLCKENSENT